MRGPGADRVVPVVEAADALRRGLLRRVLRVPGVRGVFVSPERRIPLAFGGAVAASLLLAVLHPVGLLLWGVALFGIPHVLSGVRHLALRRRLHPLSRVLCLTAVVLGAGLLFGGGRPVLKAVTVCFALSVLVELWSAPGVPALPRLGASAAVLVGSALALAFHGLFLVAVTHLHALGSILFCAHLARRRGISHLPLTVGVALGALAIALGGFDATLLGVGLGTAVGPDEVVGWLGGTFAEARPEVAHRMLVLYAFGQSVHYAVWVRLVPELDRPSPVPWSFRRGLEALRRDAGPWAVPALVACAAGTVWLLRGGAPARETYFALVYFHMGLEAAGFTRSLLVAPLGATGGSARRGGTGRGFEPA